jgi:hypothetical protein
MITSNDVAGILVGAEQLEIGQVLLPAAGAFVLDERRAIENRHANAFDLAFDARTPRFVEGQPGDGGHHIDAERRKPELRDDVRALEIRAREAKRIERRAECRKRFIDTLGVRRVTSHPNVQVDGGAGYSVRAKRVCANDEEASLSPDELLQDVVKLLDHVSRGRNAR